MDAIPKVGKAPRSDLGQETWAILDNKYSSMAQDVRKYFNFGRNLYKMSESIPTSVGIYTSRVQLRVRIVM